MLFFPFLSSFFINLCYFLSLISFFIFYVHLVQLIILSSLYSKNKSKKFTHKLSWFIYNNSHRTTLSHLNIYYHNHLQSQKTPKRNNIIPIPNIQPAIGSSKTNNIPNPKPIKHTPNVFFNIFKYSPPP